MAFNNEIRVLTTNDTNHADNFNEPLQELLENTQFNAKQIGVLPTLKTTNKEDLVGAINESVNEIKTLQNRNFIPSADPTSLGRDIPTVPSDYVYRFGISGLKNRTAMGLTGGGYVHSLGINSWTDISANVYELMFSQDGMYYRKSNGDNSWETPKKIATTDKIDVPLPYNSGYEHDTAFNYSSVIIINQFKQGRIYFNVKKTDGSTFKVGEQHNVATLPSPYLGALNVGGTCTSSHNLTCYNTCALYNNILTVFCKVESIAITGYLDYEVV